MTYLDTQIVSYAYRRGRRGVHGARICSVVANEFLQVYNNKPAELPITFRAEAQFLATPAT